MENNIIKTTGTHSKIGNLKVYSTFIKVSDLLSENFYSNNLRDKCFAHGILNNLYYKLILAGKKADRDDFLDEFTRNRRLDIPPIVFCTEKELAKYPFFPTEIHLNSSNHLPLQLLDASFFVEPFKELVKINVDFLECELPINIFHGLTGFSERILFLLTNNIRIDSGENDLHLGRIRENILPFIKNDI